MGMETLTNAAQAAGFSMVAAEEHHITDALPKTSPESRSRDVPRVSLSSRFWELCRRTLWG